MLCDGQRAADVLAADPDRENSLYWAKAGLDLVRKNVESTGYPADRIRYVQGKVEDTLPGAAPERIALLRLDTDWYQSTRHEMEHLYPRLAPGGVLIIDDYGAWEGARKAVDEYFGRDPDPPPCSAGSTTRAGSPSNPAGDPRPDPSPPGQGRGPVVTGDGP